MTRVDRETLEALSLMGRRHWHSELNITAKRLYRRDATDAFTKKHRVIVRYVVATRRSLGRLQGQGFVEARHVCTRAGAKLPLIFGKLYKITKLGKARLKRD